MIQHRGHTLDSTSAVPSYIKVRRLAPSYLFAKLDDPGDEFVTGLGAILDSLPMHVVLSSGHMDRYLVSKIAKLKTKI
jgi:hypothetical protein